MNSIATERVSVVVPCLNEEKYLGELLQALQQQTRQPDEVIIVEGGSSDGTLGVFDMWRATAPELLLTLFPFPGASIPQALNAGIALATGAVIVRLDAHSVPAPNYIADALAHVADARIGVVGGVWSVQPGRPSVCAQAIARAVSHPLGAGDAKYRIGTNLKAPLTVDTVPFGCFRQELWRALDGFDETLHVNEDYDFNYRARQLGRCVFLDPRIRSTYFARPTIGALAKQYFRYGWWKVQMLRKHPASLRWRQAVPALFVAAVTLLALAGLVVSAAWMVLASLLTVYSAAIVSTSVAACARDRHWRTLPALIAAFVTVHFCWGSGVLLNLLTGSRWPYPIRVPASHSSVTSWT